MSGFSIFSLIIGVVLVFEGYLALKNRSNFSKDLSAKESENLGKIMLPVGIAFGLSAFAPSILQNSVLFLLPYIGVMMLLYYRAQAKDK